MEVVLELLNPKTNIGARRSRWRGGDLAWMAGDGGLHF